MAKRENFKKLGLNVFIVLEIGEWRK